jgi:hypothetical protein
LNELPACKDSESPAANQGRDEKEITPEQKSLLGGHDFRQYPTVQELSASKDTKRV